MNTQRSADKIFALADKLEAAGIITKAFHTAIIAKVGEMEKWIDTNIFDILDYFGVKIPTTDPTTPTNAPTTPTSAPTSKKFKNIFKKMIPCFIKGTFINDVTQKTRFLDPLSPLYISHTNFFLLYGSVKPHQTSLPSKNWTSFKNDPSGSLIFTKKLTNFIIFSTSTCNNTWFSTLNIHLN